MSLYAALFAFTACSTAPESPPAATVPVAAPAPTPAASAAPADAGAGHHGGGGAEAAAHGPGGAEGGHGPESAGHQHGENAAAVTGEFATIVTDLRARQAKIGDLITAGKLPEVHPETEAMGRLAVAAAAKADPATKAAASIAALNVKKSADELHKKADGGDAAGSKAAFDAMVAALDALAAASK